MFSPKKWQLAILLLSAVLFSAAPAVAAPMFEVDVTISGLGDFDLTAFDLNVNYDDTLLTFDSYMLTEELGSFTGPDPDYPDAEDWSDNPDPIGDLVNLAVFSYLFDLSTQPDAFTLATLTFSGDEAGLAGISLSDIILSDDFGDPISFTVSGTDISAVPIPGAALLLVSGLVGVVGLRRRARK